MSRGRGGLGDSSDQVYSSSQPSVLSYAPSIAATSDPDDISATLEPVAERRTDASPSRPFSASFNPKTPARSYFHRSFHDARRMFQASAVVTLLNFS